jgi:TP901 family phage tail tape measure protein
MAEQGMNFSIDASTNIQSVAQKIIKSLGNISNQFQDLSDLIVDFVKASGQASGSISKMAQSAGAGVSGIDKLKKALGESSAAARRVIKDLDPSKFNLNDLSTKEIEQFVSALRDAGSSLSEFLSGNVIGEFDRANQAVEGLAQELRGLSGVSQESGPLLALADLSENREEADRVLQTIQELQKELKAIGPAAESGNKQAIQDYERMTNELDQATQQAEGLAVALKATAGIFESAVGGINQSLQEGGFQQITLEDIFPSAEQRKVDEMQRKISSAVAESVRAGAVQKTLQFFTGTGREATDVTERLDRNIVQLTSHLPRMRYALYDVSNSLAVFGGGLLAASAGAIKLSADFERAFADVIRTTGLAGDEVEDEAKRLRASLIDISQELPIAFGDVAEIATLAGQLNIANESIGNFTENVAKFASTTDVTVEAAATAFGRLDQLVEGVNGQFDKLGSSILAVGVNAVATESDIIAIATQIASVANIAGFSASELIGFSSALASVGTRPELARGTFTRLFTEIQQSVAEGGDQLNAFANVAGQSVEQFTAAWGAGSGAEQVLAILRGLQAEGKSADQALAQLGITSVRDVPTLLKLAQSVEEVDKQIRIANLGFAEGTELNEQYNVITSTLSEKVAVLRNNLAALGAAFGSASGPLTFLVDALITVTKAFEEILDNPVNSRIAGFLTLVAGTIGVLGLFGSLVARVAGGFVGFATALIEGFEAIGLMKVSMDQATVSTARNSVVTEVNKKSKFALAVENYKAARAQRVETAATNADTAAKNGLTVATTRAIAATRAYKFAIGGLGVGLLITGVFLLADALFKQVGAADEAADANEKLVESLGDISPFMAAVQKDTENFRKATGEARKEFDTFGGSVKSNNLEISDRGKILAVVTGQEDLLAGAVGKTADQLENQTLAIGENTEALIRQKIAQDLANEAIQDGFELGDVQEAFRLQRTIEAGVVDIGPGAVGNESILAAQSQLDKISNQVGLGSIFEVVADPALSAALTQAGFDFQEYIDAVVAGNNDVADSVLQKLKPAAEELANSLEAEDPEKYADAIIYLRGAAEFGADALSNYSSAGSRLRESIKRLVFEQSILNGAFDETSQSAEEFRDALKGVVDEAFAEINAERRAEEAVNALGAAFRNNSADVVASGEEMQTAIKAVLDTASTPEEATQALTGFYQAIVDGGYASGEQLEILQGIIKDTYAEFVGLTIETLKVQRAALSAAGSDRGFFNRFGKEVPDSIKNASAEAAKLDAQIAALEGSIDKVTTGTANSAKYANQLAQGYSDAEKAASGTKDEVEEIEEATRTLLDYAGDLESVFRRAFDLRFARGSAIDDLTDAWESFTEQVQNATESLEELQATQQDLAADRSIKEYFLSVAEAYDDQLRAAKLRAEIAKLDQDQAKAARELAEAEETAAGATSLTGQGPGARQNRQALLGLVRNYQDYITVLAESGAGQDELRAATEEARKEFIKQATELGFAEDEVMMYAEAFDDVRTAINRVPRDITVDFNADPALQALNELNAKLDQSIEKTKELQRVSGQPVGGGGGGGGGGSTPAPVSIPIVSEEKLKADLKLFDQQIRTTPSPQVRSALIDSKRWTARALSKLYYDGGFTGRGNKMEPAGIVHRGEYVIPKQFVNQSTGMPDPSFLAQLQNGMRGFQMGGFVGGPMAGGDGSVMVELSPYDRKLLENAGNVQLRLNGRVVAEATNQSNFNQARRGSD